MGMSFYLTALLKWRRRSMLKLICKLIFYISKGDDLMMAMLFAQKIILGKLTFSDVPAKLKAAVKEVLIECGCEEMTAE